MTDRTAIQVRMPAREKERFGEWCEREGHVISGETGRQAERAILDYLPAEYVPDRFRDDLDAAEEQLRGMCQAVGASDELSSTNITRDGDTGEGAVCNYYIAEDVQEALKRYVYDQEGKTQGVTGDYLAAAFREYRDGGRAADVRRLVERLAEGADIAPANPVPQIVHALKEDRGEIEQIHIRAVEDTAEDILETASEDLLRKHAENTVDELGLVAVDGANGVYATPARAAKIAEENAAGELDVMAWENLDREGRVEELTERMRSRASSAATQGERYRAGYREVMEDILNDHPSPQYAYDLMEIAGEETGFKYHSPKGQKVLTYNAEWESQTPSTASTDTDPAGDTREEPDATADVDAAAEQMDALEGATQVRADGGVATDGPPLDVFDGAASPPEPDPEPEPDGDAGEEDSVGLLYPTCPTDGQMLSADAHRDGREWECPRCRQRWTAPEVFPDV